jgi:glutaminyl-peptide cyclotransferase
VLRKSLASLVLAVLVVVSAGCSDDEQRDPLAGIERAPGEVARLRVEVVSSWPHDPAASTQGLELLDSGNLLESTGQYGQSSIREVEVETGRVVERRALPADHFGEGLTVVDGRAFQLTWREGKALVWDLSTWEQVDAFDYRGQGWGLCHDGERFVMSDGSANLTFRSTEDFGVTGEIEVRLLGRPQPELNELECVGGRVFANVYRTDRIVEIDPTTGAVTAEIDASGLLSPGERSRANVLNGIAYDGDGENFLVTGKNWPRLFEVRFVADG